ncbi:RNA polymerase sigma-70 factor [uncultured Butyricimonas sp.]|uniref:RNA polymerase sigma-70 factor n=1 Tax=uncultured Butyricimonas sp. TaxID=1268785 RepID=UPI0026DBFDA5|nr:RNA polymerase sigma-70 factor [uncultured Butyricimonas sp.]
MERVKNKESMCTGFEDIFKQHFATLCTHATTFVNDPDASKDIVHDVFLSLWSHREEIDFSRPILPYLFSLTRNRAINYLAHRKVEDAHAQQALVEEPVYTLSEPSDRDELINRIIKRIDQLPERCSRVMKLCFIECKKYKEIAEELNISVNTVKTHVTTGLNILRDEFPSSLLLLLLVHEDSLHNDSTPEGYQR